MQESAGSVILTLAAVMKVAEWENGEMELEKIGRGKLIFPLDLLCIALQCSGTDESIQKQRMEYITA